MRLILFACQDKSHNIPCYYCIAQLSANQGRALPQADSGTTGRAHLIGDGRAHPLKQEIGVPTLPFIA